MLTFAEQHLHSHQIRRNFWKYKPCLIHY